VTFVPNRPAASADDGYDRLSAHLSSIADGLITARQAVRRRDRGAVKRAVDALHRAASLARARVRVIEAHHADAQTPGWFKSRARP
jgi:hypothetical protein